MKKQVFLLVLIATGLLAIVNAQSPSNNIYFGLRYDFGSCPTLAFDTPAPGTAGTQVRSIETTSDALSAFNMYIGISVGFIIDKMWSIEGSLGMISYSSLQNTTYTSSETYLGYGTATANDKLGLDIEAVNLEAAVRCNVFRQSVAILNLIGGAGYIKGSQQYEDDVWGLVDRSIGSWPTYTEDTPYPSYSNKALSTWKDSWYLTFSAEFELKIEFVSFFVLGGTRIYPMGILSGNGSAIINDGVNQRTVKLENDIFLPFGGLGFRVYL